MTVMIPAYMPDELLLELVNELKQHSTINILIVDDASGNNFEHIFAQAKELGCTVLKHEKNMGNGKALKTGFQYLIDSKETGVVVTVDAEGEYSVADILKIAEAAETHIDGITLGSRHYKGKVPLKAKIANAFNRAVFSMASGKTVYDMQTGLRGYNVALLPWLCHVVGDGYNYEMNMLLDAVTDNISFFELEINPVFVPRKKRHKHLRKLSDSIKIYLPIIKYSLSSLTAGVVDYVLVIVIDYILKIFFHIDAALSLFIAVAVGRVITCLVNYYMNKHLVFSKKESTSIRNSFFRYTLLVIGMIITNYFLLLLLTVTLKIPLEIGKLIADNSLYFPAYWVQRKYVFK